MSLPLLDFVFEQIIEDTIITTKSIFKSDTGFDGDLNSFSKYPVLTLTPYADPILDTEFTTKKYVDTLASFKAPLESPAFTGTITGITKDMIGLSNVNNTSDASKPISTATQSAIDLKAPIDSPAFTGTITGITKSMISLSNVDNTSDASKPVSTAQQTALDLKAPLESPSFTGTITGITKDMVGLSNVNNTNDASKPISTATQSAIDLKAPIDSPAFTGVATFNSFLPTSTVNPNSSTQLVTKGYVDTAVANVINSAPEALNTLNELSLALGNDPNFATTVSTNIGLKAPISNPTFTGTVSGITKSMVGLSNADNTSDSLKPVSTAQQTALDLKAPLESPAFTGTITGITKAMVGLSNVDNTSDASKPVSTAQQTALDLKAPLESPAFTGTITGITKAMVGLSNVDNTDDASKPISTAQQSALDLKAPIANPTFTGTVTASSLNTSVSITENLVANTPSGNAFTLNFSLGNTFYATSNPSGNFTVSLTNIPTNYTTKQYTINLLIPVGGFYCSSATATDTMSATFVSSQVPKRIYGLNPSIGVSSVVIHTFTVIGCFATKQILYTSSMFN